jgi:hypothetical protein
MSESGPERATEEGRRLAMAVYDEAGDPSGDEEVARQIADALGMDLEGRYDGASDHGDPGWWVRERPDCLLEEREWAEILDFGLATRLWEGWEAVLTANEPSVGGSRWEARS